MGRNKKIQSISWVSVPGGPRWKIKLDYHSHYSGTQRAYIKCPKTDHGEGCWRYRHITQDPDRKTLRAHLYTWARCAA